MNQRISKYLKLSAQECQVEVKVIKKIQTLEAIKAKIKNHQVNKTKLRNKNKN
jgi:hypothetical protein